MKRHICSSILALIQLTAAVAAQTTSVIYDLSHHVIAGGGGYSQWTQPDIRTGELSSTVPNFEVEGTIGQAIAGTTSTGSTLSVHGGFWFYDPLQSTAASVSVSGKVMAPDGRGLRNAIVKMTDSSGVVRRATTSSFGLYRFDNVPSGKTYVINVLSKLYRFQLRLVSVSDELTNVDFVGLE